MATVLVYLDDVHDGGETKFPGEPSCVLLQLIAAARIRWLVDDIKWMDGILTCKGLDDRLVDGWIQTVDHK